MREPLQELREDAYERPNQPWLCGLTDAAGPCPLGPGRGGRCPAAAACHPVREGDRWRCNRSSARGGPCSDGPTPEGECAHVYHCTPIMSQRQKRGRFVVGCALAAVGALTLVLSADWRNEAISPGGLSAHHAQLLQGTAVSDRCARCHAAAPQTFSEWLGHIADAELTRPSQTELCLKCHHNRIEPATATGAHNVDPQVLLASHADGAPLPEDRPRDPTHEIACSACHREHHGPAHNLSAMSDAACQACHREQFHGFSAGHPEFTDWPTRRRTRIAFDHASHEAKHFPQEKREFQCAACHQPTEGDTFMRTLSYEEMCAVCHDAALAASWESGVPVFALPMLDTTTLEQSGFDVGQWPDVASGEFDGSLPPVTKLLIAAEARAAAALLTLGSNFDFFDVDVNDTPQLTAAADLVWATKELLHDLATKGQSAVQTRVEALLGRSISTVELNELTAHLAPENVAVVTRLWLTGLPEEITQRRGVQAPAVEADSPPAEADSATAEVDRDAVRERVAGGGWFRDDLTLSIRYRPNGHADRFVTAWIDLLVELASGSHAGLAQPLLRAELAPTAPGLCGSCHSVDRSADGKFTVNWLARQSAEPGFTVFSHAPHLAQMQLADCRACHTIDASANVAATYQGDSPHEFVAGFQPLTRESCALCHTKRAAGESCTLCHRYHTGLASSEDSDEPARADGIR